MLFYLSIMGVIVTITKVEGKRECSKVAATEYRAVQLIESLVIETFGDRPVHVLLESVYVEDRAGNGIALNQV